MALTTCLPLPTSRTCCHSATRRTIISATYPVARVVVGMTTDILVGHGTRIGVRVMVDETNAVEVETMVIEDETEVEAGITRRGTDGTHIVSATDGNETILEGDRRHGPLFYPSSMSEH